MRVNCGDGVEDNKSLRLYIEVVYAEMFTHCII